MTSKVNQKENNRLFKWFSIILGFIILFLIYLWFFGGISQQFQEEQNVIRALYTYSHKYQCDGKLLNDECDHSYITSGGIWIKDCKSGNEYICQSVVEMPNDKP